MGFVDDINKSIMKTVNRHKAKEAWWNAKTLEELETAEHWIMQAYEPHGNIELAIMSAFRIKKIEEILEKDEQENQKETL